MAQVRNPRGVVKIDGQAIPGWIDWTVTNNAYYEADTFHVTFSTSRLPSSNDANWFSEQTETFVEILAGFPTNPAQPDPSELQSLIYGRIDDSDYDPIRGTLALKGRDLTAVFIDAKISQDYANKTSSQIAIQLAQNHGLAYVATQTTTLVGSYYELDSMHLQTSRSEWDLLAYLARQEGFVAYVEGQILFFQKDDAPSQDPYLISIQKPGSNLGSPNANVLTAMFSRSQTVSKGITVTVKSAGRFNPTVTKSYPTAPKSITPGKSSPFGGTTNYFFNIAAGASPTHVQLEAERIYNQIIQHAMKLSATLPADSVLNAHVPIKVSGTDTAYDQMYFPKIITRAMSREEGYTMTVEAQNSNPNLSPATPPNDDGSTESAPSDDDTNGS
jgi:hypothetical protein